MHLCIFKIGVDTANQKRTMTTDSKLPTELGGAHLSQAQPSEAHTCPSVLHSGTGLAKLIP